MSVKQRARQSGVELPLVISDHADWNELRQTIAETGARPSGSPTAARTRWSTTASSRASQAEPLRIEAYEEDPEETMKKFAQLLELLALTPSRNRKIEALTQYFRDDARSRPRLCARHPHRRADASRT